MVSLTHCFDLDLNEKRQGLKPGLLSFRSRPKQCAEVTFSLLDLQVVHKKNPGKLDDLFIFTFQANY